MILNAIWVSVSDVPPAIASLMFSHDDTMMRDWMEENTYFIFQSTFGESRWDVVHLVHPNLTCDAGKVVQVIRLYEIMLYFRMQYGTRLRMTHVVCVCVTRMRVTRIRVN